MSDRDFDRFLPNFFADLADARAQILGISDTTPPAAKWDRLVRAGEMARNFGPINDRRPSRSL